MKGPRDAAVAGVAVATPGICGRRGTFLGSGGMPKKARALGVLSSSVLAAAKILLEIQYTKTPAR